MPTKEWTEGKDAFEEGEMLDANPYPRGTIQRRDWDAGWQWAFEESED